MSIEQLKETSDQLLASYAVLYEDDFKQAFESKQASESKQAFCYLLQHLTSEGIEKSNRYVIQERLDKMKATDDMTNLFLEIISADKKEIKESIKYLYETFNDDPYYPDLKYCYEFKTLTVGINQQPKFNVNDNVKLDEFLSVVETLDCVRGTNVQRVIEYIIKTNYRIACYKIALGNKYPHSRNPEKTKKIRRRLCKFLNEHHLTFESSLRIE